MAEHEVRWITGKARDARSVERICPGRHVRSDQWKREWNRDYLNNSSPYCYDFISDYECFLSYPVNPMPPMELWEELQDKKRKGTPVSITNVAHFTNLQDANAIIDDGGFLGNRKKINEEVGEERNAICAKLSWWSPLFSASDACQVRDHLGTVMRPFLADAESVDSLKEQFATSNPCSISRSQCFFRYGIDELLQEYRTCCRSEIDYRILGTFAYKAEVMHAVLVCGTASGEGRFSAYPRVVAPADNAEVTAVTRDDNGRWTWRPEATATEITRLQGGPVYPKYRRYDHIAFAFHIPEDCYVMQVRDLKSHLVYRKTCKGS